jgi:hypothetical protein
MRPDYGRPPVVTRKRYAQTVRASGICLLTLQYRQAVSAALNHFAFRLFLALAGSGLCYGASDPATYDLPSTLDPFAASGWVLADLDGNHSVDLATSRTGRHDSHGYAQEVRVTMGAFRHTSFYFQSRGADITLNSRDVDGDQDRDLIVLEPFSGELIAIWINDGAGDFHEGNLADFRGVLSHSPSHLLSPRERVALLALSENRVQTAPEISPDGACRAVERLTPDSEPARQFLFYFEHRTRGPPSLT